MSGRVRVGTCGFPEARRRLFHDLDMLEVQQTFYHPPRLETARRWREEAPQAFAFSLKAWQLITHPSSSPTYRRLRLSLSEKERDQCGGFRLTPLTVKAWGSTCDIARILQATAVVCQTPPSFGPDPENLERMHAFFSRVPRGEWKVVFEPRGPQWTEDVLRPLLSECNLIHGLDPFLTRPLTERWHYFRLHGLPAYRYGYRYSDEDLTKLKERLPQEGSVHVLFNTIGMAKDARRFKNLLE